MSSTRLLVDSGDPEVLAHLDALAQRRDLRLVHPEAATGNSPPHVIIIDLDGQGDRLDLLRSLARRRSRAAVVLTGSCNGRTLVGAQRVGVGRGLRMLKPLAKPLTADRLNRALVEALRPDSIVITRDDVVAALERDEFLLHFQPLVDIRTESVHGAEALLRWNHPEYGMQPPLPVVSVAEQNGLGLPLSLWVIRSAMTEYRRWQREGWRFKLAVNVSADVLRETGFAEQVVGIAKESGVPAEVLALEVTESQILTEEVDVLDTLTALRLEGVDLAIDDFGTGYSSLGRLLRMPFSELKIDKTFVIGASEDRDADAEVIVHAISELGKNLGLTVVAEGVSSREAWELVEQHHCDVAQGFFIAKPTVADEFTRWLYRWGVPTGVGEKAHAEARRRGHRPIQNGEPRHWRPGPSRDDVAPPDASPSEPPASDGPSSGTTPSDMAPSGTLDTSPADAPEVPPTGTNGTGRATPADAGTPSDHRAAPPAGDVGADDARPGAGHDAHRAGSDDARDDDADQAPSREDDPRRDGACDDDPRPDASRGDDPRLKPARDDPRPTNGGPTPA